MNTENQEEVIVDDGALRFPLKISSSMVAAAEIIIESDLLPETIILISSAKNMLDQKKGLTINDLASYETAAEQLAKIKAAAKSIEEKRKDITKPYDERKKEVMDYVRPYAEALSNTETIIKSAMIAYDDEQEKKRMLEDAEAEKVRRETEEKLIKRADAADATGKTEKADALREIAASTVVAAPAISVAHKVSGVSSKKKYEAEVVDLKTLIDAVAAGKAPIQALQADMTFLNKMAVAFKDDFDYPGCKLSVSKSMAIRAKK